MRTGEGTGIAQFSSSQGWSPGLPSSPLGSCSRLHSAQWLHSTRMSIWEAVRADSDGHLCRCPPVPHGSQGTGCGTDCELGNQKKQGESWPGEVREVSLRRKGGSACEEGAEFWAVGYWLSVETSGCMRGAQRKLFHSAVFFFFFGTFITRQVFTYAISSNPCIDPMKEAVILLPFGR